MPYHPAAINNHRGLRGVVYALQCRPPRTRLREKQAPRQPDDTIGELRRAANWQGFVELEREELALASDVRLPDLGLADSIHGVLGRGFEGVGQYARALALHAEFKAIEEEELGDLTGVVTACWNILRHLSNSCYASHSVLLLKAVETFRSFIGLDSLYRQTINKAIGALARETCVWRRSMCRGRRAVYYVRISSRGDSPAGLLDVPAVGLQ